MSMTKTLPVQQLCKVDADSIYSISINAKTLLFSFYTPSKNECFLLLISDFNTTVSEQISKRCQNSSSDTEIKLVGSEDFISKAEALILSHSQIQNIKKNTLLNQHNAYFYGQNGRLRLSVDHPTIHSSNKKIRVAIVDDSKTIQDLLTKVLHQDPEFEVVATYSNPLDALKGIEQVNPDVITLDIHMPEMNGVVLLSKILAKKFIPAVMITSLSLEDGPEVLKALELGAVEYIQKPSLKELQQASIFIREKIKIASQVKKSAKSNFALTSPLLTNQSFSDEWINSGLIAIGSSTGGTEALKELLTRLPKEVPPILIVQHIPAVFSAALAKRLNDLCPFEVKEASDNDEVKSNRVLIAPGGKHMTIRKRGKQFFVQLSDEPVNMRHKPSVDVLFQSIAKYDFSNLSGVILTGMGNDGAKGLLELKHKGAKTFCQDEQSSVVYGMPREAKKIGAVDLELPLIEIPHSLMKCSQKKRAA